MGVSIESSACARRMRTPSRNAQRRALSPRRIRGSARRLAASAASAAHLSSRRLDVESASSRTALRARTAALRVAARSRSRRSGAHRRDRAAVLREVDAREVDAVAQRGHHHALDAALEALDQARAEVVRLGRSACCASSTAAIDCASGRPIQIGSRRAPLDLLEDHHRAVGVVVEHDARHAHGDDAGLGVVAARVSRSTPRGRAERAGARACGPSHDLAPSIPRLAAGGRKRRRPRPGAASAFRPVQTWSGRLDSNQRPLRPERSALPNCATPRQREAGVCHFPVLAPASGAGPYHAARSGRTHWTPRSSAGSLPRRSLSPSRRWRCGRAGSSMRPRTTLAALAGVTLLARGAADPALAVRAHARRSIPRRSRCSRAATRRAPPTRRRCASSATTRSSSSRWRPTTCSGASAC